MGKYFDFENPLKKITEKKNNPNVKKFYLRQAEEMHKRFPHLGLNECLRLIVDARKQLQEKRLK